MTRVVVHVDGLPDLGHIQPRVEGCAYTAADLRAWHDRLSSHRVAAHRFSTATLQENFRTVVVEVTGMLEGRDRYDCRVILLPGGERGDAVGGLLDDDVADFARVPLAPDVVWTALGLDPT